MRNIVLVLSIILLFSIACTTSNEPEAETKEFLNTEWHLESIEVSTGEIIKPPEGQIYTIKFLPDGIFSGDNACNDIGGEYILLANSKITINTLGTSFALCPEENIEDEYYGALNDLRSHEAMYEIQQNKLHINYGVDSRMVFIFR